MSKVAVVFWSGTGNTETMAATLVADGVMANNAPDDAALAECDSLGAALA